MRTSLCFQSVFGRPPLPVRTRGRMTLVFLGWLFLVPFLLHARPDFHFEWLGPDGEKLPFQSFSQIEDFLMTAAIVGDTPVGQGVTGIRRLTLEKDGVRMWAAFRHLRLNLPKAELSDGRVELNFKDDCMFEIAAYRLSELLQIHRIPPTVRRKVDGVEGSLQAWLVNARPSGSFEEGFHPEAGLDWVRQWHILNLFDELVSNADRNAGNILIDEGGRLWLIDHSRSFRLVNHLKEPQNLASCPVWLWERLKEVTDDEIRGALRPTLSGAEISAVLKRRDLVVRHFEMLIQRRGESVVLY